MHRSFIFFVGFLLVIGIVITVRKTQSVQFSEFDGTHQWLTASSVKFVNNWLSDGIVNDKFLFYEDSKSIEFEQYNRDIYVSYPPGSELPIYLAARICGKHQIGISFVKHFVQYEFYFSIFLLAFFYCLIGIKLRIGSIWEITLVAVVLSAVWAFLPFDFYYLQNVFFSDQAIILLSLAFFINEFLLLTAKSRSSRNIYQALSFLLVIAGVLTDYYFLTIVAISFLLRMLWVYKHQSISGKGAVIKIVISRTFDLFMGSLLALACFIIQISKVSGGYQMLKSKFIERTAISADSPALHFNFKQGILFLLNNFRNAFGVPFTCLLPLFLIASIWIILRARDKKRLLLFYPMVLILGSSVLHTMLLMNHSVIHKFSMIKYSFAFTNVIFTVWCYYKLYPEQIEKIPFATTRLMKAGITVLITFYLLHTSYLSAKPFYISQTGIKYIEHPALDQYIRHSLSYNDIAFSPDFEVVPNPPFDMAITRKRVYKINAPAEIVTKPLPENAMINIFIRDSTLSRPEWKYLLPISKLIIPHENVYLIKVRQKELK